MPIGDDFWYIDFESCISPALYITIFVNSNNLSGRFAGKFKIKISTAINYFEDVTRDLNRKSTILEVVN